MYLYLYTYTYISVSSEPKIEAAFLPGNCIFMWFKKVEIWLQWNVFNPCVLEGAM